MQDSAPVPSLRQRLGQAAAALIRRPLASLWLAALEDPRVRERLWSAVQQRPDSDLLYLPHNLQKEMYRVATVSSAAWLSAHHPLAAPHRSALPLLDTCVDRALAAPAGELFLEFGVFDGRTINHMADRVRARGVTVHGFDSFKGLPEDWNATGRKGLFDRGGRLPEVRDNVRLHPGWFDNTLPPFLKAHTEPVAFLHIDSDLYSSARTVLTLARDRLHPGTVILFDEFLNYPDYEAHEFKAFAEFLAETGFKAECLGYDAGGFAVGFEIHA